MPHNRALLQRYLTMSTTTTTFRSCRMDRCSAGVSKSTARRCHLQPPSPRLAPAFITHAGCSTNRTDRPLTSHSVGAQKISTTTRILDRRTSRPTLKMSRLHQFPPGGTTRAQCVKTTAYLSVGDARNSPAYLATLVAKVSRPSVLGTFSLAA